MNSKQKSSQMRKHYNAVLAGSAARNGTRLVLNALVQRANFYKNETTVSKDELLELTQLGIVTVKRALAFLRDEGSIEATSHATGGYGRATTYALRVVGGDIVPDDVPAAWRAVLDYFLNEREAAFSRWIEPLEFVSIEGDTLRLRAPSEFHETQVTKSFGERIIDLASGEDPAVKRLRFEK